MPTDSDTWYPSFSPELGLRTSIRDLIPRETRRPWTHRILRRSLAIPLIAYLAIFDGTPAILAAWFGAGRAAKFWIVGFGDIDAAEAAETRCVWVWKFVGIAFAAGAPEMCISDEAGCSRGACR